MRGDMAIRITEIQWDGDKDNAGLPAFERVDNKHPKTLRVEGTLHLEDAELLERVCKEVLTESDRPLIVEVSNICSLDRESANVLCRMKHQMGIEIMGMNLYIKKVIEITDDEVNRCG